jgi:hypothetical protein
MDDKSIVAWVKKHSEPVPALGGGNAYRCAAYLKDGLYLPCVLVAGKKGWIALAKQRLAEDKSVIETFVASGNRVNGYDIERLEPSRYAVRAALLRQVPGETSMSWTQFVGVMRDGREFAFATTYYNEFFTMPEGYTAEDLVSVRAHDRGNTQWYRERPFFTCYVDGI